MRARHPIAVLFLSLSLAAPAAALPVVRIALASTDHHPPATVASDTADYIRNSAIANTFGITTGKIAQRMSRNDDVRHFSKVVIDDDTSMQDALTTTLEQAEFAMTLPPS